LIDVFKILFRKQNPKNFPDNHSIIREERQVKTMAKRGQKSLVFKPGITKKNIFKTDEPSVTK